MSDIEYYCFPSCEGVSFPNKTFTINKDQRQRINEYLETYLYENEIKPRRNSSEVRSITKAVKDIVTKLMNAVSEEEPLMEISQQYLVGSMAERTNIGEVDEFDFLVELNHFSNSDAVRAHQMYDGNIKQVVENHSIHRDMFKGNVYAKVDHETNRISFENEFLSTILRNILSSLQLQLFDTITTQGKMSVQSKMVCHHGPASVIKLLWEPTSEDSTHLDILVNITPCIKQIGIDNIIMPEDVAIFDHYILMLNEYDLEVDEEEEDEEEGNNAREATAQNILCMLVHTNLNFLPTFTLTEIKIVRQLRPHEIYCYKILKYCMNNIIIKCRRPFPSYCIKAFILKHADSHKENMSTCLWECLVGTLNKMAGAFSAEGQSCDGGLIYGIFLKYQLPIEIKNELSGSIENIVEALVQIGKDGYSVSRHDDLRHVCQRTAPVHPAIQKRADRLTHDQIECLLPLSCSTHENYNYSRRFKSDAPGYEFNIDVPDDSGASSKLL